MYGTHSNHPASRCSFRRGFSPSTFFEGPVLRCGACTSVHPIRNSNNCGLPNYISTCGLEPTVLGIAVSRGRYPARQCPHRAPIRSVQHRNIRPMMHNVVLLSVPCKCTVVSCSRNNCAASIFSLSATRSSRVKQLLFSAFTSVPCSSKSCMAFILSFIIAYAPINVWCSSVQPALSWALISALCPISISEESIGCCQVQWSPTIRVPNINAYAVGK